MKTTNNESKLNIKKNTPKKKTKITEVIYHKIGRWQLIKQRKKKNRSYDTIIMIIIIIIIINYDKIKRKETNDNQWPENEFIITYINCRIDVKRNFEVKWRFYFIFSFGGNKFHSIQFYQLMGDKHSIICCCWRFNHSFIHWSCINFDVTRSQKKEMITTENISVMKGNDYTTIIIVVWW